MKYDVRIGGRTFAVEIEAGRVRLDGTELDAQVAPIPGTPLHHLLLGGTSWTVAADALEGVGRWALGAAGERFEVEVIDDETRQAQAIAAPRPAVPSAPGVRTLTAPMPGLIVRIEVAEGQRVEAGAGLVVVEAMKMENEVRAPRAGVVATVHVAVGAAVEKGAALVTLASA